ncbi:hypothetical protein ASPWEDRAFT_30378 [Aspergillus wentii DTO 134E9]|uniref:Uncharacterized protein n=1 Tax=Aspergillus wentii DTO 134E9 TaxID=1073089 RepID=A0A1L9REJ1_ASPWE|nr:uncharacterized protein ASPWEDRAFT_30378 [Aspergillus wentii DTO 134E9]OJJ33283.1 hypothetical protein ASPWEDRAFT_30378 [Aspergillus wentii DTO 134E9]
MSHPTNTTNGAHHQLIYSPPLSSPAPIDTSDISQTDLFMDSQLRAGGPYLCAIPTISTTIHPTHPSYGIHLNKDLLIEGAKEYLNDAGIMHTQFIICQQWSEYWPEAIPVPTMIIYARRQSQDEQWRETAREIYAYFQRNGFGDVCVDIRDEELRKPLRSWHDQSDQVCQIEDTLDEELSKIIPRDDYITTMFSKSGRAEEKEDNPPTITILFFLHMDLFRQYKKEIDDVRDLLARFDITDTAIIFRKDEIWRGPARGPTFSFGSWV